MNVQNGRFKCKHCNYEWWSRVELPKACPMCKQYKKAELIIEPPLEEFDENKLTKRVSIQEVKDVIDLIKKNECTKK